MFWSRRMSTRKTILPALIACVVVSVLLITVSGHSGKWAAGKDDSRSTPSDSRALSSSVLTPQGKKDQRLEIEVVTITADGFEPQQLERTAGPFILSVTNQSGADALNVRIETEQHERFREKSLPLLTRYWRERIDPPPGKYIITEENHPEWTLTFIIK
jgi:hypothetical protein